MACQETERFMKELLRVSVKLVMITRGNNVEKLDPKVSQGIVSVFKIIKTIRTLRLRIVIDRLATGEKRAPFTRRWTPYWGQGLPQSLL